MAQLSYEWKGWDETHACRLFQWFHDDLMEALAQNNMHEIRMCIERILVWGGINKTPKTANMFEYRLPCLLRKLHDRHGVLSRELMDDSISSWTKVLAAYDPKKFCIYDSRVAIALSFLFRNRIWFIPWSYDNDLTNAIQDNVPENDNKYQDYLIYSELVRNADPDNPGKYERKLFMLGGVLKEMNAANPNLWVQAVNW